MPNKRHYIDPITKNNILSTAIQLESDDVFDYCGCNSKAILLLTARDVFQMYGWDIQFFGWPNGCFTWVPCKDSDGVLDNDLIVEGYLDCMEKYSEDEELH